MKYFSSSLCSLLIVLALGFSTTVAAQSSESRTVVTLDEFNQAPIEFQESVKASPDKYIVLDTENNEKVDLWRTDGDNTPNSEVKRERRLQEAQTEAKQEREDKEKMMKNFTEMKEAGLLEEGMGPEDAWAIKQSELRNQEAQPEPTQTGADADVPMSPSDVKSDKK